MTAGVGKARPPRSFPTGLAKCLRPEAQTQTVAKPRIAYLGESRVSCTLRALTTLWKMLRHKALGRRREASAPRAARRSAKRPEGVSKYKGCARSARRTPIFANEQTQGLRAVSAHSADICGGSETMSAPKGSVSPVGCQAQRKAPRRCAGGKCQPCGLLPPKAAKRPEGVSKYKGCARPARTAPIFAKGREARMMEQPMIPLRPAPCQPPAPARLCRAALFCALSIPRGT